MISNVRDLIQFHEGCKLHAYWDPIGSCYTAGWGATGFEITKDTVLTQSEADAYLDADIATAAKDAQNYAGPSWASLSLPRQAVIIDLAYELGRHRLRGFVKLQAAIRAEDWNEAAAELRNSRLAEQAPGRVTGNAQILVDGVFPGAHG